MARVGAWLAGLGVLGGLVLGTLVVAVSDAAAEGLEVAATATTITVSWEAVSDAEGYQVHYRGLGWRDDKGRIAKGWVETRDTTVTLGDLEPGRKYDVSLWVRYAGDGDWRERHWAEVTTEAAEEVRPRVSVTGGVAISEGGVARFTIDADPSPASALRVSLTVSQSGDYAASGTTGGKRVSIPTTGSATYTVATVDDGTDEADGSITVRVNGGDGYDIGSSATATVSVSDNDELPPPTLTPPSTPAPTVTISAGSGVSEGSPASFTVTASPSPGSPITVSLTVGQSGDYAASGSTGTKSVTVPTTGSATYSVATVDDGTDEANGSITVRVNGGDGYDVGSPAATTVAVSDNDDPPPTVTISAGSGVNEGSPASFTVTASPAPGSPITVSLTVSQSGDYAASGTTGTKSLTIPTTGSATYSVATVDDGTDEADGSITVRVNGGDGYDVGSPAATTVAVSDNDDPPPTVTISAGSGVNEGSPASFTVTASPAPGSPITVSLTVGQSGDYAASGTTGGKSVTIPTGGSATYSVATVDDGKDEANGSITVRVNGGNGYDVGSSATATVSVTDDDPTPEQETADSCKTNDAGLLAQVEAKVARHGTSGRADLLEMFSRVASTMKGKDTYTVAELRSRPDKQHANWDRPGPNALWQAVYKELDRLEACRGDAPAKPQSTDTTPEVSVSAGADITEGGAASFTITASPAPTSPLAVSFAISQSGDYAASGSTGTKTVTIPTSGSAAYSVATVDDATDEVDGSVTATLASGNGYTLGSPSAATVRVADNDDPPPKASVTITAGPDIAEGGSASFTITASPAPTSPITVSLSVSQSGDYAASGTTGTKSVTVPTAGSAAYSVATDDDATDEADGSVTVTLTGGGGSAYDIGSPATATVAVADDDDPPIEVKIEAVTTGPITEGQTATFRVTASRTPGSNLAVKIDINHGSEFLTSSAAHTVAIPANQTTATLEIPTEDDDVYDGNGPLTVKVWAMRGYLAGDPMMATVPVEDNDPKPPVVSIAAVTDRITEGAAARYRLTSDLAPAADLMVKIDLIERGGYVASTDPITVVIPMGQLTQTFSVATIDDHVAESSGAVTAKVWAMPSYLAGDPMMATVTVEDNDSQKVRLVAGPAVREGQAARFDLVASPPPSVPVTVTYSVVESGSGDRVLGADEGVGKTATVPVSGSVSLSIPTATPAGDQGTGTIRVAITNVSGAGYGIGTPTNGEVLVGDPVDYDVDNDGLIDVNDLTQLNAIRWDTDGNGQADTYAPSNAKYLPRQVWTDHERIVLYAQAYPFAVAGMGCPSAGCKGFELKQHLDFDTNGDGKVDRPGDDYWNDGRGWLPISGVIIREHSLDVCLIAPNLWDYLHTATCGHNVPKWPFAFRGIFEGNGYTIRNLYVNDARLYGGGLFGYSQDSATIRNLGLTVAAGSGSMVRANKYVGALGGFMHGTITGVYSNVDVNGQNDVGGLIGTVGGKRNGNVIETYATGNVTGPGSRGFGIGGLVGKVGGHSGLVAANFATGTVTTHGGDPGGLIGQKWSLRVAANYATGNVNHSNESGLNGWTMSGGFIGSLYTANGVERVESGYSTGKVGIDGRRGAFSGSISFCALNHYPHIHDLYWDTVASALTNSACGTGKSTVDLQTPTGYTGIYADWDVDVDGDGKNDDPWDFGTASQYPILKYCGDKTGIDMKPDPEDSTQMVVAATGKTEYCPLREVLQHGRKASVTP